MKILLIVLFCLALLIIAAWFTARFVFSAADHSRYDQPRPQLIHPAKEESTEHKMESRLILESQSDQAKTSWQAQTLAMRELLDARGEAMKINADIKPVDAGGIDAEWVMAPNIDPRRRILYIHGGAYMVGSAKSHRLITSRLSALSGAAVLAINQKLMPEHSRLTGITDCRQSYAWILDNGPDGPSPSHTLIVAGDSSGGNLTLTTIAWARDTGKRPADAVVVFSPQTDATLSSPSLLTNTQTDIMQGKSFGPIVRAPKVISLWMSYLLQRINPSSPMVSPLFGDLSNLPPTLIQVSDAEMFLDDAVRYTNKANTQGSTTVLQTWPHMMHVWQAFRLPEADQAYEAVGHFLNEYAPLD